MFLMPWVLGVPGLQKAHGTRSVPWLPAFVAQRSFFNAAVLALNHPKSRRARERALRHKFPPWGGFQKWHVQRRHSNLRQAQPARAGIIQTLLSHVMYPWERS